MSNSTQPFNKWAAFGFTTTPEERIGPGPPYSYPALEVNLFFRVFIGLVSLFVTWVPARVLWRNGEFAGTVLCVTLMILNFMTVVNALIWRNDNVMTWYAGYGWCDLQVYIQFPLHSAFNISLFEIMRGLAAKVAVNRVLAPTAKERHRQRMISAAVIFTVPVIQLALTYVVTVGRYNVSTLLGCVALYYPSWIYLVFYIIPTPAFAVGAAYMAVLTEIRYRKIERVTNVIRSDDEAAAARQGRVRRKLYFMTLFITICVLPLITALMVSYIIQGGDVWSKPYDFNAVHFGPDPANIHFISFTTSDMMGWIDLCVDYIGLLAGIIMFIPFGSTPDALNAYRKCLLAIGLGRFFPRLNNEYHPSTRPSSKVSWWSSVARTLRGKSSLASSSSPGSTQKDSLLPTVSLSSGGQPISPLRTQDSTNGMLETPQQPEKTATSSAHHNPWPDLSADELDLATAQIQATPAPPPHNPFIFRTAPISISTPSLTTRTTRDQTQTQNQSQPQPQPSGSYSPFPSDTPSPSRKDSPAPVPGQNTPVTAAEISPWSEERPRVGVDTRVWASENGSNSDNNSSSSSSSRRIMGTGGWDSDLEVGRRPVVMVETSIARSSMAVAGTTPEGGMMMVESDRRASSAAS